MWICKYFLIIVMQRKTYWIFILLAMEGFPSRAQKTIHHTNQQWIQYYNQTRIDENIYFGIDGGFRWKDGDKLQYIARTGLMYQINEKLRVVGGVATTGSYQLNQLAKVEFRPYQEVSGVISDDKVSITSRFRLEERFFKNRLDVPVTHDFNFRFRYQLSVNVPVIKFTEDNSRRLLLTVSEEIFMNAGEEIDYNVFDRDRILIGPAWQMSKSLILGATYLYQFAARNSPATYDSDNILWITLRHNMDLRNSKAGH